MSKFPNIEQFEVVFSDGQASPLNATAEGFPDREPFVFTVPAAKSERIIDSSVLRQTEEHAWLPSVGKVENWLEASFEGLANVGIAWYDIIRLSLCSSYKLGHDRMVFALRWFPHEGALCLEYREYANDNAPIGRIKIEEGMDGTKDLHVALRLDADMRLTVLLNHADLANGSEPTSFVIQLNRNSYRNLRLAWSAGVHMEPGADSHGAAVAKLTALEVFHGIPNYELAGVGAGIKPEELAPVKVRQQGSRKKK